MNKNNIFCKIGSWIGAAALLLSVAVLPSCNNEEEPNIPYLRLENVIAQSKTVSNASDLGFDLAAIIGGPTIELIRYDVRSNGRWSVECSSADKSWLQIHPITGEGDGIVRFCATDNDNISPRATTVVFRYENGQQTEVTLAVNQHANVPYIQPVVYNATGVVVESILAERAAESFTIRVGANIDYFYSATKADWFTITEKGNGLLQLDIQRYPDVAAILEREATISFKGVGDYASITSEISLLQTVVPYIKLSGDEVVTDEDSGAQSLTPFPAAAADTKTFKLKANYAWTIASSTSPWYTVSPLEGEAYKEYTITVKSTGKNTGAERDGVLTLTANTATIELALLQEGQGGATKPVEGLPVYWSFPETAVADNMVNLVDRWYLSDDKAAQISIFQPQRTPANPNMSFTLGADNEMGRVLSYGFCVDNYWLFSVPVKNLRADTSIRLNTIMSSSAAGPKFFMLEYSTDNQKSWTAVNTKNHTTPSGRAVTCTLMLPYDIPNNIANQDLVVAETFAIAKTLSSGTLFLRLRVCDPRANKDDKDIIPGNGGTTRMKTRLASCEKISIEVVE